MIATTIIAWLGEKVKRRSANFAGPQISQITQIILFTVIRVREVNGEARP